jgi:hypothetical protein
VEVKNMRENTEDDEEEVIISPPLSMLLLLRTAPLHRTDLFLTSGNARRCSGGLQN